MIDWTRKRKVLTTISITVTLLIVATLFNTNVNSTSHNNSDTTPQQQQHRRLSQLLDPKTVILKNTDGGRDTRESEILQNLRIPPNKLRYAAFGASSTWGSGLEDRFTQAYPWILSPNAKNYAIRAAGPNYPAACAYSMMGEEEFDVIILEFFPQGRYGLVPLAKRLRERFPDAIIIILREWYPRLVVNGAGYGLRDWAERKGFGRFAIHDPAMHEKFLTGRAEWDWHLIINEDLIACQEEAAKEINGYILEMPRPENIEDWIKYADLFAEDYMHKSAKGHIQVAERVRDLVDRVGVPRNPRMGAWGYTDSCHSWFESGDPSGISFSKNVVLNKFAEKAGDKYALEFPEDEESYFTVTNPSTVPQALYLVYMTTGPPPSKYGPVEITMMGVDEDPIVLNMDSPPAYDNLFFVHVHKVEEVAHIPPGETTMKVRQLEKGEWPFRLVSVVVTKKIEGKEGFSRMSGTKLKAAKKAKESF